MDEKEFIREAKTWLGCKWMHGVACKGVAVDCAQLIIELAKVFGATPRDYSMVYDRQQAVHNNESLFLQELPKFSELLTKNDSLKVGDVIVFYVRQEKAHHAGIYLGEGTFIHSQIRRGCRLENLEIGWRVHSIWRPRYDTN